VKALDASNVDLSALAIVGCLGDQQDKGPKRAFGRVEHGDTQGRDFSEACRGHSRLDLLWSTDEAYFTRRSQPQHRRSYLDFRGMRDKCLALLDSANIQTKVDDRWRTVSDLSVDEKRRLVD